MQTILQELVYDAGSEGAVWPFDRHYIRPPHFHGQIELLLILRGSARVHLGAQTIKVRAGQLCWIPPGVPHVMSEFSGDFDMWVVELEAALLGACWRATVQSSDDRQSQLYDWMVLFGDRLSGRPVVDVGSQELRDIDALAREIWSAGAHGDPSAGLRRLCQTSLRITLASLRSPATGTASVTQLASCLMLASPALGRREVAAELGVSDGFLSRCFSREMGTTFVEHRARTRVAHFLALVQTRRRNLLEAALAAGFGSYTQFHRVFSAVAGSSPREYLNGGRRERELLVAGDSNQPQSTAARRLPEQRRQRVGQPRAELGR